MKPNKYQVNATLTEEVFRALEDEVARRNTRVTPLVRQILEERYHMGPYHDIQSVVRYEVRKALTTAFAADS